MRLHMGSGGREQLPHPEQMAPASIFTAAALKLRDSWTGKKWWNHIYVNADVDVM